MRRNNQASATELPPDLRHRILCSLEPRRGVTVRIKEKRSSLLWKKQDRAQWKIRAVQFMQDETTPFQKTRTATSLPRCSHMAKTSRNILLVLNEEITGISSIHGTSSRKLRPRELKYFFPSFAQYDRVESQEEANNVKEETKHKSERLRQTCKAQVGFAKTPLGMSLGHESRTPQAGEHIAPSTPTIVMFTSPDWQSSWYGSCRA